MGKKFEKIWGHLPYYFFWEYRKCPIFHIFQGPWIGAMEATLFTGWVYDFLKPHAVELKVAHPEMLKAIKAVKRKTTRPMRKRSPTCCWSTYCPEFSGIVYDNQTVTNAKPNKRKNNLRVVINKANKS